MIPLSKGHSRRSALRTVSAGATAVAMLPRQSDAQSVLPNRKEVPTSKVNYRTQQVDDVQFFYREAEPMDAPVVLLLHGFPTSGHMFRELIPALSDRYRVIAPDLPGFGLTKTPPRGTFEYSFDHLAAAIGGFVNARTYTLRDLCCRLWGRTTRKSPT